MPPAYVKKSGDYQFPYHHLPERDAEGGMSLGRVWFMGFEYLVYMEEVLREVAALRPSRVLDFGCGDGRLSAEMAARGVPDVVGVDISERAIAFARAFGLGTACRFHCADVRTLDERGFDVAVAMEVLEHIPDDDLPGILGAIAERLVPGGRLVVCVPTTVLERDPSKHHRHYDESLLVSQAAGWFDVRSARRVFRVSAAERWLRRLMMNRLFIANDESWVRRLSAAYRRRVGCATEQDGGHIVAVLQRTAAV